MKIAIGSLWKELDPRVTRVVRIVDYDTVEVKISNLKGTRVTRVNAESFARRFAPVPPEAKS